MTIRSFLTTVAAMLLLCSAVANADVQSVRFVQGDIEANVPKGWTTEVQLAPGIRMLASRLRPEQPDASPELFWLEATPLRDISPKTFVETFLQHVGVEPKAVEERESALAYEMHLTGEINGNALRATFICYRQGSKIHLLASSAQPAEFDSLGSRKLLKRFHAVPPYVFSSLNDNKPLANPASIVAKANGFSLTEKGLEDALAFGEFLANHPFTSAQRARLRQATIEQFDSVTREDFDAFSQISRIADLLPAMSVAKRATTRRDLTRDIYFALQESAQPSTLMDIVFEYNPVLGADKTLNVIVTIDQYRSQLTSNFFVADQAGITPMAASAIEKAVNDLRRGYSGISEKEKAYLANAEINSLKLITIWQSWDAAKRRQMMGWAGVDKVTHPDQVPKVARDLEHLAGFDMTNAQVLKMIEQQQATGNLEYMRMMIGAYTAF